MKAKELMIGDWVEMNLSPSTSEQYYFKSKIVVSNLVSLENGYDFDAKPITLTPEILENNGFKYEESYNEWWHYDPFPFSDFQIGYEDEDDMRLAINGDTTNIKLKYVHQLQHALRLCGLNELADNFKVI